MLAATQASSTSSFHKCDRTPLQVRLIQFAILSTEMRPHHLLLWLLSTFAVHSLTLRLKVPALENCQQRGRRSREASILSTSSLPPLGASWSRSITAQSKAHAQRGHSGTSLSRALCPGLSPSCLWLSPGASVSSCSSCQQRHTCQPIKELVWPLPDTPKDDGVTSDCVEPPSCLPKGLCAWGIFFV